MFWTGRREFQRELMLDNRRDGKICAENSSSPSIPMTRAISTMQFMLRGSGTVGASGYTLLMWPPTWNRPARWIEKRAAAEQAFSSQAVGFRCCRRDLAKASAVSILASIGSHILYLFISTNTGLQKARALRT